MTKSLKVIEGCKALSLPKGATLTVVEIVSLGADYSHQAKVVVRYQGRTLSLFARHPNRLADASFGLNNGDPTKRVVVKFSH